SVVSVLGPLIAAPVRIKPRIGPAHGAHNKPVAIPRTIEGVIRSVPPVFSARRLPSATNGRVIQVATRVEMSATPKPASSTNAAMRPYEFSRTAHAPPTAASVAMPANVTAMPASIGNVPRAKERPGCANTNGSTGRMHGLMIVSAPPRNAIRASSMALFADRADRYSLGAIQIGQRALEVAHLRHVVEHDVRLRRVLQQVVLVIALRVIETLELVDACDDRFAEQAGLVELRDVGGRDLFLPVVRIEDRRTILRAGIRPLPVELRRVVDHG